VITAPFRADDTPKPDELPLWKQPWVLDLLRAGAVPAALAIVALGLIFGAIRPAIQAAKPLPPPEPEAGETAVTALNAVVDDEESLPGAGDNETLALEGPGPDKRLEMAIQLSKDNPLAVANVLRGWMNN
jgi:flagellar M-ring protein FliF